MACFVSFQYGPRQVMINLDQVIWLEKFDNGAANVHFPGAKDNSMLLDSESAPGFFAALEKCESGDGA